MTLENKSQNIRKLETQIEVPSWLRFLNVITLAPILFWPLLFFNAGAMLESTMDYKWPIFILMVIYPLILIGNIFTTRFFFKKNKGRTGLVISIILAFLVSYSMIKFFLPIFS